MAESELATFALTQRRRGLTKRTITDRDRILRRCERGIGKPLIEATAEDIELWLDSCRLGNRSRYSYLSHIRVYLAWAQKRGLVTTSQAADIIPPRLPRLLPRPMTYDDLAYALEQADQRMRVWLMLGAYQGLRAGEVAKLRREDVLEREDPPLLRVVQGKGNKDRVLPLNRQVESELRSYGLPATGFVFRLEDGRPIGPRTLSVYANRFLHELGIASTFHSLRHRFGSTVFRETKDIRVTQELLGHAALSSTMIYTEATVGDSAHVVRDLDIVMGRGQLRGRRAGERRGDSLNGRDRSDDPSEGAGEREAERRAFVGGVGGGDPPRAEVERVGVGVVPSVEQEDGCDGGGVRREFGHEASFSGSDGKRVVGRLAPGFRSSNPWNVP